MRSPEFVTFDRVVIAVTAVLTLVTVPWLLDFAGTHDWPESARDELAAMATEDRDSLNANYERYHQLTDDQRRKVDELHKLSEDPAVAEVMARYHQWLSDLDVAGRDLVRSAPTTDRKLTQVRQRMRDQEEEDRSFSIGLIGFAEQLREWERRRSPNELRQRLIELVRGIESVMANAEISDVRITDHELDRIVATIVPRLDEHKQKEFASRVENVIGDDQEASRLRARVLGRVLGRSVPRGTRAPEWLTPALSNQIFSALDDSQTREALKSLSDDEKNFVVGMILLRGLSSMRDLERHFPDRRQMEEYYASLSRQKQIDLMRLASQRSRSRRRTIEGQLQLMYVIAREDAPQDIIDLARSHLSASTRARGPRSRRRSEKRRPKRAPERPRSD